MMHSARGERLGYWTSAKTASKLVSKAEESRRSDRGGKAVARHGRFRQIDLEIIVRKDIFSVNLPIPVVVVYASRSNEVHRGGGGIIFFLINALTEPVGDTFYTYRKRRQEHCESIRYHSNSDS